MHQSHDVEELRQYVQHWKDHGESVAFIPTMGNLHEGHLSLIRKGQSLCDRSICSIFVNPMQFGPNEDFNHYPRTLDHDIQLLESVGCDLVYMPTASELYPDGLDKISQIHVTGLTETAVRRLLQAVGLRLESVSKSVEPGAKIPLGQSIQQSPNAGAELPRSRTVLVVFAAAKPDSGK